LAGEGLLKVGEGPEQQVLLELGNLVPRVEHDIILVGAREGELDTGVAVHLPALTPAARRLHHTTPIHACKVGRLPRTLVATVGIPLQVLEPSLLELKDLKKRSQSSSANCHPW
jgi:hypothetical protein